MMQLDEFGVAHLSESDICELLYKTPDLNLSDVLADNPDEYNESVSVTYAGFRKLAKYAKQEENVDAFDRRNQSTWHMPQEYQNLDIAKWILDQCQNETELQRAGEELILFAEADLLPLLCYLKYLVDTFRQNKIVWGVGRGSSVASFLLYLIGIHKINPIFYQISISEFFKETH
jgi:DNA polymerase III alpha subunit